MLLVACCCLYVDGVVDSHSLFFVFVGDCLTFVVIGVCWVLNDMSVVLYCVLSSSCCCLCIVGVCFGELC